MRQGLLMRLAVEKDFAVIGEAADCQTAQDLAGALRPDVVLIDMDTPHVNGIAIAALLCRLCPQVAVIMLSLHDDSCARKIAADAGAAAFVAKSLPADALLTAIRDTFRAQTVKRQGGKDIVQ